MKNLIIICSTFTLLSACSSLPKEYNESLVSGPKAKFTLAGTSTMSEIAWLGTKTNIYAEIYDYNKLVDGSGCSIEEGILSSPKISYEKALLGHLLLENIKEEKSVIIPAKPLYIYYNYHQSAYKLSTSNMYRIRLDTQANSDYKFLYTQKVRKLKRGGKEREVLLGGFSVLEKVGGTYKKIDSKRVTNVTDQSIFCSELRKQVTK